MKEVLEKADVPSESKGVDIDNYCFVHGVSISSEQTVCREQSTRNMECVSCRLFLTDVSAEDE